MVGHCARRSLRTPWKLGLRIVAWWKPCMFCEESLGKIKFRAFPIRVGPRIPLLQSIDYFGTLWTPLSGRKKRILITKTAMVGCCKLSAMIEMTCLVNHFFDLWQWCNFSGIEAFEFSCIYTRVWVRPQTYFRSSLTRVLNRFRNK